jgi:hypothetical protein
MAPEIHRWTSQSDAQRSNRLQNFLFAVLRKSYGDFGPHLNA